MTIQAWSPYQFGTFAGCFIGHPDFSGSMPRWPRSRTRWVPRLRRWRRLGSCGILPRCRLSAVRPRPRTFGRRQPVPTSNLRARSGGSFTERRTTTCRKRARGTALVFEHVGSMWGRAGDAASRPLGRFRRGRGRISPQACFASGFERLSVRLTIDSDAF